jgi:defect-in-organelle-trafficking protein DotD
LNEKVFLVIAIKNFGLTTLVSMGLMGCAAAPTQLHPDESDPVAQKIAILAEQMVANSNKLAKLERARYIEEGNKDLSFDVRELPVMQKTINLGETYTGPLEPFLRQLSAYVGMNEVRYLGLEPSAGVLVNVDVNFRPLIDIMDDIGQQTGSRAIVVYKASENLLEVKYRGL